MVKIGRIRNNTRRLLGENDAFRKFGEWIGETWKKAYLDILERKCGIYRSDKWPLRVEKCLVEIKGPGQDNWGNGKPRYQKGKKAGKE
jgi:hypothetical protein